MPKRLSQFRLRIPEDLHAKVAARAAENNATLNDTIGDLLRIALAGDAGPTSATDAPTKVLLGLVRAVLAFSSQRLSRPWHSDEKAERAALDAVCHALGRPQADASKELDTQIIDDMKRYMAAAANFAVLLS